AYYVEWHMRQWLAPLLFDYEDKAEGETLRASVVAPARRSPKAEQKALTKRTQDDYPVHSFQSLLNELATITLNKVMVAGQSWDQVTTPTRVQQRAFDLLKIPLK
ncbi:MAG: IS1634 family transposase, partial [Pseudomonadota bacterium]